MVGLQRWTTGVQAPSKGSEFREVVYKDVFQEHLRQLQDWTALNPAVTTDIRTAMYKKFL
jgi:hypothetical protein